MPAGDVHLGRRKESSAAISVRENGGGDPKKNNFL